MSFLGGVRPVNAARLRVTWRAAAVVWAEHARRFAARHPSFPSLLLVVLGLGAGLAGGALIGEWCLGLVMIAESACLVWVGWNRDDGRGQPAAFEAPTVQQVLERARHTP